MIDNLIIEYIKSHKEFWNKIRQNLHQNPEPTTKEIETTKKIKSLLVNWGYQVLETGEAGVVGILKHGSSDSKVAIKVNIDAIQMDEESELTYQSKNNYMHASGNDGHITMLLGACQYLSESRNFNGTFYAIFESGQQNCSGAKKMVENGLITKMNPSAIFSLQVLPLIQLENGKMGDFYFYEVQNPIIPSLDMFEYCIIGKDTYCCSPCNGHDPIIAASSIIMNLQTIISRDLPPFSKSIITIGAINSSNQSATSVSKKISIKISVMSIDQKTREYLLKRIETIIEKTCSMYECDFLKNLIGSNPMEKVNQKETQFGKDIAINLFGSEKVHELPQLMFSDDITYLFKTIPGTLIFVNNGNSADLHTTKFDFEDKVTPFGVCLFINIVEKKLI